MKGSTSERRRLSKIFQREMVEIGFAHHAARLVRHASEQPLRDLPVAAHPAMLAPGVGAVVRGIVVDDFDVGEQPHARVGAFDQVVAEQRIAGEAAFEHGMQSVDFIDALAGEDAFAIQILVYVGDGAACRCRSRSGRSRWQPGGNAMPSCTLTPTRGCRMP